MTFNNLSIKKESNRFLNHLQIPDNNKIILSGIFGIGKSYFIDNFFKVNKKNYITIKLDPVNYSVSQNEDIFELIKFDIAFQLLGTEGINFETVDIDTKIAAQYYLINNFKSTIEFLVKNLSKLNRQVDTIVAPTLRLKDKIEEFRSENSVDEEMQLETFLESFSLKKGTYREENSITELITILIQKLKKDNALKEIVLIIDDLDRIDPGHIFRILNIFSAHFDYYNNIGKNKFDFDKVILICDIENIKQIFHNLYGLKTDFSGYLDKFYSDKVFIYNFNNIIKQSLGKFLNSIKIDKHTTSELSLKSQSYYKSSLSMILSIAVESNTLNMRSLIKFLKKPYSISHIIIPINNNKSSRPIYSEESPIIIVFDILKKIFGSLDNLKESLEKIIFKKPVIEITPFIDDYMEKRLGNILLFADCRSNRFIASPTFYEYSVNEFDLKMKYNVVGNDNQNSGKGLLVRTGKLNDNLDQSYENNKQFMQLQIPYFQLFLKALENFETILEHRN